MGKVSDSDSETETVSNTKLGATGKRKPASSGTSASVIGKSSSGNRKSQKDAGSYSSAPSSHESCHTPTVEEKKCPMAGCDSTGNLPSLQFSYFHIQLYLLLFLF